MIYKRSFGSNSNSNNPFGSILSVLIFVGILIFLLFMVTSFVKLLYLVAPVLLIATLLINYRLVTEYVMGVFDTFQNDVVLGIVKVLFSVFCYPFVIGWLFAKAMFFRKVGHLQNEMAQKMGALNKKENNTQYADYEEISSDIVQKEDAEKPIILEAPKPKDKLRDDYDQLFK